MGASRGNILEAKVSCGLLQEGDRNTAFFHNTVKARRSGNSITSLVSTFGDQLFSKEAISLKAKRYFSQLFSKDEPGS